MGFHLWLLIVLLAGVLPAQEVLYATIESDGAVDQTYSFNPLGSIQVASGGTGIYDVTFNGLTTDYTGTGGNGVFLVRPTGFNSHRCVLAGFLPPTATVRCRNVSGTAVNTGFVVTHVPRYNVQSIFFATNVGSTGNAIKNAWQSYNANGDITLTRTGTGTYTVNFAGQNGANVFPLVTPLTGDDTKFCVALATLPAVNVNCFNTNGPVDSPFSLAVIPGGAQNVTAARITSVGTISASIAPISDASVSSSRTGPGAYSVTFQNIITSGLAGGMFQVSTAATTAVNCKLMGLSTAEGSGNATTTVLCSNQSGALTDVAFTAAYIPPSIVRNGSFELSMLSASPSATAPLGWTWTEATGQHVQDNGTAINGRQYVELRQGNTKAAIGQLLKTISGRYYRVTVSYARLGTQYASFGLSFGPNQNSASVNGGVLSTSGWVTYSFDFQATSVQSLLNLYNPIYQSNPNYLGTIVDAVDVKLLPEGATCSFNVSPTTFQFNSTGSPAQTLNITNTSGTNCPWFTAPTTGGVGYDNVDTLPTAGTGTIGVLLMPYDVVGGTRTITTQLAGKTLTLHQTGPSAVPCTFALSQPSVNVSATGITNTSVQLNNTAGTGCGWSITGIPAWVTVSSALSGTGSTTVAYSVQSNPSATLRSATLSIGGLPFTINQTAAASCAFTLNPPSHSAPSTGSNGVAVTVNNTAGSNCAWTVSGAPAWVTITSGAGGGTGSGTVILSVAQNNDTTARAATLTIAGQLFTINQAAAASCAFTLNPPSHTAPSTGSNGVAVTVNNTAGSNCAWTVSGAPAWVTITSGAGGGTGSGTVILNVAQNNDTTARAATLIIAGIQFSISQAGAPGPCAFGLSQSNLSVAATESNNLSIQVTNSSGSNCTWTVATTESWIVPVTTSGTGSGAVLFHVMANPSTTARTGVLTAAGQVLAITQAGTTGPAPSTAGLRFVALDPCRILETRAEYNFQGRTGPFGPPFLNAGETRSLSLPVSNVCAVPASARAFVLNITIIPRNNQPVDFVTVYPSGETRPTYWTLRSPDAQVIANSAIVAAGSNSGIEVYASNATDLIIDIAGYFTDNPAVSNLVYYPLTPCRVVDTRSLYRPPAGNAFGPPTFQARETKAYRFPQTPYCTVPAGAAAYSITLTVDPQSQPLQFLTTWPSGRAMPNVSSINSPGGRILANSVIVPANAEGSIDVHAFDRTDLIIDINGYFAPDDGTNGLYFYPVRQCRVADSSNAAFTGSFGPPVYENESVRSLLVPAQTACSGVPANARAFAVNTTVMPNGNPMPFLTLYPTGQPRPNASTINAFQGQTISSAAIIPAGPNGGIDVFAYRRTHVVVEISGYFGR